MTPQITIMCIIGGLFAASSAAADSFVINFNTGGSKPRNLVAFTSPEEPQPDEQKASLAAAAPMPARAHAKPEVVEMIRRVGQRYASHPALREAGISGLDWLLLFQANIEIESAYKTNARSHVGAIGLGQLMPATAQDLGVNPRDPEQNLDGSARYLLSMLNKFGTPALALAAYNAGPDAVSRHGGIPPYRETQGHVRKVLGVWSRLRS